MARDRSVRVRLSASVDDYIKGLGAASAATKALQHEAEKLDRSDPTVDVDVNAKKALAEMKAAATAGEQVAESFTATAKSTDAVSSSMKRSTDPTAALTKAQRRLEDASAKVTIAEQRLVEVQKKAKAGSSQLLSAQNMLRKAMRDRADATDEVARAQADVSRLSHESADGLRDLGDAGNSFVRRSVRGPAILAGIAAGAALIGPATAAAAAGVAELGAAAAIAALAYHGFKQEIEDGTELGQQVQGEIDKITAAIDHLGRVAAGGAGPGVVSAFQQISAYLSGMDGPVRRLATHLGNAFSIGTGGLISALETMAPLLEDAGVDAEQLARKFAEFARSQEFKDFIAYARKELPQVIDMLESLTKGAVALGKALAPVGEGLITAMDGFGKFLQVAPDVIARLGRVGDLSHGPKAFAENLIHLGAASDDVKVHMAPMDDQLQSYKSHLNAADNAARQLAANQRNAGPSMDAFGNKLVDIDGKAVDARTAIQNLANSIRGLGSDALNTSQAQISFQQAIDDAKASVKQYGKATNIASKAGQSNRRTLNQIAVSSHGVTAALVEQGASQDRVTGSMRRGRKAFIDAAVSMGYSTREARKLARQAGFTRGNIDKVTQSLHDVPRNTTANVRASGTAQARAEIDAVADALARIDRSVTVNIRTVRTYGGGTLRYLREGRADGGTITGTRYPYADKVLTPTAPGEEIISNRYGQADRYRELLKAINADRSGGAVPKVTKGYADGGTVSMMTPRFSSMGPVSRPAVATAGVSASGPQRVEGMLQIVDLERGLVRLVDGRIDRVAARTAGHV